jgi:DNA-binding transcriptional LysR family regulator
MDLEGVRVFVAVAEHGSFRGAASALGQPKSTVSRRIAALEEELATRLLQRTTRKVALTDAGLEYLRRCQPALAALEDAARAVSEHTTELRGRIRVTAAPHFAERMLGPIVNEFLVRHPGTQIELVLSDRHLDLVQEGIDIALRAGRLPDSTLVARELGRAATRFYAAPSYLARKGTPKRPSDVRDHDCILYTALSPDGRWPFRERGRVVHVQVSGPLTANSMPLALEAAIAGLGVVRLPESFAADALLEGTLVEVLEGFIMPEATMQIVWPSGRHLPARVRALVDLLRERLDPELLRVARVRDGSRPRSRSTTASPTPRANRPARRARST